MRWTMLAVTATLAASLTACGASYPHAWCGPLIREVTAARGPEASYEAALNGIAGRYHAPDGKLVSDLIRRAAMASLVMQDFGDQFQAEDQASEAAAEHAVVSDLKALNRECGQSPAAWRGDSL